MEYIRSFFSYFFNPNPGSGFSYYVHLIVLASLLIAGAVIFSYYYKKKKKTDFAFKRLFKTLSNRLLLIGVLLLVVIALRYENIPYFSMRILIYALLLALLYIAYKYVKIYIVKYPKEKANAESKKHHVKTEENKYLPNKKKK